MNPGSFFEFDQQLCCWLLCIMGLLLYGPVCQVSSNHLRHDRSVVGQCCPREMNTAYKLRENLLKNYKKTVRPVVKTGQSVPVSVYIALYQVISLDQAKNTIILTGSFEFYWRDEFLNWDPEMYNGSREIFLSSSEIWIPEISLYYSHHHDEEVILRSNNDVRLNATGHLRYYIPFTTKSICPIDVKFFPFDKQTCDLFFGSWAHSNESLSFKLYSGTVDFNDFYDNQEWQMREEECKIVEQDWPYDYLGTRQWWSVLVLTIVLQREHFYYVFNLVIPSTIITLTAVIGFHVPSNSGRVRDAKFRLGIMTLMSMSMILLAVVEDMPKFSMRSSGPNKSGKKKGKYSGVPLIGLYYFSLLVIISLSTVTTSFFVLLERYGKAQRAIPWVLKWLTVGDALRRYKGYKRTDPKKESPANETPRTQLKRELSVSHYDNLVLFHYFHAIMEDICSCLERMQGDAAGIRHELLSLLPKDDNETQWSVVIFRLEMISLALYLCLLTTMLVMFFYHDWYKNVL